MWKDFLNSTESKVVFSDPLGPIPWVLEEANVKLKKSSKAKIMHEQEKGVTGVERVDAPFTPRFDEMAVVHMVKCTGLAYNQFADDLLKLKVAKSCGSKQMNVVFDVYWENSIKNAGRGNCSTGQIQFSVIIGSAKITQWGTFLSNNKNKWSWFNFWFQGEKVNVQQLENRSCMFPLMKNASVYSPMVYVNLLKLLNATMRRQTWGFFCMQTTYASQLKTSFTYSILMFFWLLSQHLVKFLVACSFALAPKTKHASYPSLKWTNCWFFIV